MYIDDFDPGARGMKSSLDGRFILPVFVLMGEQVDEYARGLITTGERATLFEELGFYYIGPVDGHNIRDLVDILREVKDTNSVGPVLIHVMTEKGRGYDPAVAAADRYHGVVKFDVETGKRI